MKQIYLTGFLALAFTISKAQIVYTDIVDVTKSLDEMYQLDLNNDLSIDYIIEQTDSVVGGNPLEGVQLRHYPATINEAIYETTSLTFLAAVITNAVIDGVQLWTVPNPTLPAGGVITVGSTPFPAGDWSDGNDHYAGLRFNVGPNQYYGWVRFTVLTSGLGFTVKDYAYHSTPDQAILAGAQVDAVIENNLAGFSMQQMGSNVMLSNNVSSTNSIEIFDMSGKMISSQTMNSNSLVLDLSSYENGIYIIRCSNENGVGEFKIAIAK